MSDTIQDRTKKIETLLSQVKSHPMCLDFKEDLYHYLVIYPEGMRVDGARVEKGVNKSQSLELLLSAMDRHWDESGISIN